MILLTTPIFGRSLHPFHSSVGDCVFNAKEKVWDISIRLFQDDLADGLSQFSGLPFSFQKTTEIDAILEKYVRKNFGFQVNQKRVTPYRWIGWEPVDDTVWIYLEIPTEQDLSGVYLENRLWDLISFTSAMCGRYSLIFGWRTWNWYPFLVVAIDRRNF